MKKKGGGEGLRWKKKKEKLRNVVEKAFSIKNVSTLLLLLFNFMIIMID